MLTELSRYTSGDFALEPFPHLLIEPALPWEEYEQLEKAFPPLEVVTEGRTGGNNTAYVLSAHDVPPSVAPSMRSFSRFASLRAVASCWSRRQSVRSTI